MNETKCNFHNIENCFETSIKGDKKVGAIVPATQTEYYLAKMFMRQGDEKDSIDILMKIHNRFQAWGMSGWEKKCKQELEPYRF